MGRQPKLLCLTLALCLLGALCACGPEPPENSFEPQVTPAPPRPDAVSDNVPGEETGAEAPEDDADNTPVVTDGLEGSYYNDYLRLTLILDGTGSCVLTGADGDTAGAYTRTENGGLLLNFGTWQETAAVDGSGDISIEGRTGYFLRDWTFWGITEADPGAAASLTVSSAPTGIVDNGDGTYRFRDLENGVAFTYSAGMTVLRDGIIGGAAVSDGEGGSVTGRNVTDLYHTHSGSDDDFIEDYIRTFVYTDFGLLYGGLRGFDGLTLLHEDIDGRLAAATLRIERASDGANVEAKVLLYTSVYADGTVNYICKTLFSAAGNTDALEAAVTDMGAVRLVSD